MSHMKKYSLLAIGLMIAVMIYAQTDSLLIDQQSKKFDFSLGIGTSFMTSKVGNMGNYFFSPGLQINATPRLKFNVRSTISNPMFYNAPFNPEGDDRLVLQHKQYMSIYAETEYQITPKIQVTGSIYRNNGQGYTGAYHYGTLYNYFSNINEAYSIGIYYQLSKNIQLGAEFRRISVPQSFFWLY